MWIDSRLPSTCPRLWAEDSHFNVSCQVGSLRKAAPRSSPLPPAPSPAWSSRNLLSCRKDPVLGDQPSGPLVHLFCVTLDKTLGLSGVNFLKYIVG